MSLYACSHIFKVCLNRYFLNIANKESVKDIVTISINFAIMEKPVVEQCLAKVSSKTLKPYKSELDQVVNILRIDDQNVNFFDRRPKCIFLRIDVKPHNLHC